MNPTKLGVIGPGFLNQVPKLPFRHGRNTPPGAHGNNDDGTSRRPHPDPPEPGDPDDGDGGGNPEVTEVKL